MKKTKKTRWWKKLFKALLITVLSLFILLVTGIYFLLNFIFTPEKLTPKLVAIVNENINGQFSCRKAELTFFSSFPYFGVDLHGARLTVNDSLLLDIQSCNTSFDIMKFLKKDIIDIKKVALHQSQVHLLINKDGSSHWDHLLKKSATDPNTTTGSSSGFKIEELHVNKLNLDGIHLSYTNLQANDHLEIDSLDAAIRLNYYPDRLLLDLRTSVKTIDLVKDSMHVLKNGQVGLDAELELLKKEKKLTFKKGVVHLNGVDLDLQGHLQADTLQHTVMTDIGLQLKAPDLEKVMDLVPDKIIQQQKADVSGAVSFEARLKGIYGEQQYPAAEINMQIQNGRFRYKDFPGSINQLSADLQLIVDFNKKERSMLLFRKFSVQGSGIDLAGNITVTDLLRNPFVTTAIKCNADLNKLHDAIPFHPDLTAAGSADINLESNFFLNDLKAQDISSLFAKGMAEIRGLNVSLPKDSIALQINRLSFESHYEKEKIAVGDLVIHQALVQDTSQRINLDSVRMHFRLDRTSPDLSLLTAQVQTGTVRYRKGRRRKATWKNGTIAAEIRRNPQDRSTTTIHSTFQLDSLGVYAYKRFVGIKNGRYRIRLEKTDSNSWSPRGAVHFGKLVAYSPSFGMPVKMENSTVTLKNEILELKNTKLSFGKSSITLTGSIDNALSLHTGIDKKTTGRLTLQSGFIDANELMGAYAKVSALLPDDGEEIEEEMKIPDSLQQKQVIRLPDNIDFTFNTHIQQIRFGHLDLADIHGTVVLKDGALKLSGLKMKTLAADLTTSVSYTYVNDKEAAVNFDLNLHNIEMAKLTELLPFLDTLVPMTKDFEGQVDFRIRAKAKLDEHLMVNTPSLDGIAALQATNVMVVDSKTFRELAKTLLFKSKEKNPIEEINMEMVIKNNRLEILPSFVQIDRYQLAVGGTQQMDLSYDYHISVLKSPIPFKTGIDVKGVYDEFKIRLAKARYKYYFSDKERLQKKADSNIIRQKAAILDELDFE